MGDDPRREPVSCADCGTPMGTLTIDADGDHGDPVLHDADGTFSFAGHYIGGRFVLTCEECSDP